jgi:hypothetical protein
MIQQKIETAIKSLALLAVVTLALCFGVLATPAHLVSADAPGSGSCKIGNEPSCASVACDKNSSVDHLDTCGDPAVKGTNPDNVSCTKDNCNLIDKYINPAVNLLSVFVGLAVTISIVIGGIQYGASAGDPSAVSAAKNRIRNSIIALLAFIFLYAFLQFLVPGGIFKQ